MVRSIEDFISSIPELKNGLDDAQRIYQEASDIEDFTRIELYGAHELSRAGVQMVYIIGRGKINESPCEKDCLFYFPCMITKDFFEKDRDTRDVKVIEIERIYKLRKLQVSPENILIKIN